MTRLCRLCGRDIGFKIALERAICLYCFLSLSHELEHVARVDPALPVVLVVRERHPEWFADSISDGP
jgi:hypothetical protein